MPSLRRNYVLCIALVSIAALLASFPVRNESNRDRDGNWWISQERLVKYSYMVGFFDGMELGENFSIWGTMNTQKADLEDFEWLPFLVSKLKSLCMRNFEACREAQANGLLRIPVNENPFEKRSGDQKLSSGRS